MKCSVAGKMDRYISLCMLLWLASFLYQLTNTGKPCHNIPFIFKRMYTHVKHVLDVYHFSKR